MNPKPIDITDPQTDRYASLRLIDWWDQGLLQRSRVMVWGVGALGNEVLKNLALLGVGQLLIGDFDVIEAGNLSRSVLFRTEDIGRRKVDAAAEQLRSLNPDIQVATFHGDVTEDVGIGVYRHVDLVLGCVDNRAARLAINRACWKVGTPWIDGALDVLMGMVRAFVPPASVCYECTLTEQDYQILNLRHSCPHLRAEDLLQGRMPTTPISASFTAALQVQEALKWLHGMEVNPGKAMYFNSQTFQTYTLGYNRREDCFSHETYGNVISLAVGVDELTVGTFLETASKMVGEPVTLLSDRKLIRRWLCPNPQCQWIEPVYAPYTRDHADLTPCPRCGTNRIPDLTNRLRPMPESVDVPLRQLGIPALHIVRTMSTRGINLFEFTQDRYKIFKGWQI
jgi:molybdopterin-synthase adenylyltransferase